MPRGAQDTIASGGCLPGAAGEVGKFARPGLLTDAHDSGITDDQAAAS